MRDPRENVHVPVDGDDGESVALVRAEVERRPARNLRQLEAGLAPVGSLEPGLDKAAQVLVLLEAVAERRCGGLVRDVVVRGPDAARSQDDGELAGKLPQLVGDDVDLGSYSVKFTAFFHS